MELNLNLKTSSYKIVYGHDILRTLSSYYDFSNKKVLIVSDDNIPLKYINEVKKEIVDVYTLILPHGEETKSFPYYLKINDELIKHNFSRNDCIIALGGGVIGDLVGLAASTYKRGIDFINIPTSTLSMIDSSIGGKTAIDYKDIKNVIGTFYQPKLVLIDFDTLNSLPIRQVNNGLVEALKAGFIYDTSILELFDKDDIYSHLEEIIIKAINVKKYYVENDEKEISIRKILNYGHTFGHAFEALGGFSDSLYHGEAVGLGMLIVSEDKEKMISYLKKLNIKYDFDIDEDKIIPLILNDKKVNGEYIDLIVIENNKGVIKKTRLDSLVSYLKGGMKYVRLFRK
jgi:3-dehydroquinate synthase